MDARTFMELLTRRDFAAAEQALEEGFDTSVEIPRFKSLLGWGFRRGTRHRQVAEWLLDHIKEWPPQETLDEILQDSSQFPIPDLSERLTQLAQASSEEAVLAVDVRDDMGRTPLMLAIEKQPFSAETVREMLKRGADPNAQGTLSGTSVLMLAAHHGRMEILPDLAQAGADPNLKNHYGDVALHSVFRSMDAEQIQTFLNLFPQADINVCNHAGTPPFLQLGMSLPVLQVALAADADVNLRSGNRFHHRPTLPMMVAAGKPEEKVQPLMAQVLAKEPDLSLLNDEGDTAFAVALRQGNLNLFHMLAQADPANFAKGISTSGLDPFHGCLAFEKEEEALSIAQALLENGYTYGQMPVLPAPSPEKLTEEQEKAAQELIAPVPESVNRLHAKEPSVLYAALVRDRFSLADFLIRSAGARMEEKGPDGVPATHAFVLAWSRQQEAEAGEKRRQQMIEQLANQDKSDTKAQEAAQKAQEAAQQTQQQLAARRALMEDLLSKTDWSATNSKGENCLFEVVRQDLPGLAKVFQSCAQRPDPLQPNDAGHTPLADAFQKGRVELVLNWWKGLSKTERPSAADWLETLGKGPERHSQYQIFLALARSRQGSEWLAETDSNGRSALAVAHEARLNDFERLLLCHGVPPLDKEQASQKDQWLVEGNPFDAEYVRLCEQYDWEPDVPASTAKPKRRVNP